ncbi:PREDICTED: ATP synthase subunit d, mitochondrial-like isoform X2 [Nelumbo nucifera]|uniref:ATP synthase subunit d, mitochondrial-like isoform X2 n=1 Tax=Nelumbo nucifera TaxID=4432 RepID=A0A1U7ZI51_NELNU|nr:PREDICTED: ATP synthase subunit d, mitochondrial-like isoform X2 [Nelumbo nucifera]
MSGAGKKIADVAVKASKGIDWDGMAKLLVSEEARKKFSSLHVAFDEVRSTLQTKFSQELEPIDLEYCKKGVGSGLVDMYKEAYQQCNIWDTSRSMPIHSDGRDDRLVCEADPKDRDSIKSAYTIAYKAESLVAAREKCLDVGYKHILREANQAADWLAHRGHTSVKIDHVNLPWGLKFICLFDFWGRATPRSV